MKKLPEVEAAKELMMEATKWSVMKWLREKKRVRKTADQANAALDRFSLELKQRWPENLRSAYESVVAESGAARGNHGSCKQALPLSGADAWLMVKKVKEADEEAYHARMKAEATFDQAERQLSTRLARQGCVEAIHSWDLKEKAISKAEKLFCP